MDVPFITRVTLKNYKSIASCQVSLENLMFLVGPNGSGKSSFLDAIKFVSDALNNSLDHALRERGGIKEVRRRSEDESLDFSIRLDFVLPNENIGHYSFRIGITNKGHFMIRDEECSVLEKSGDGEPFEYRVSNGIANSRSVDPPTTVSDRLSLVNFAVYNPFRDVYDSLSRMEIYNINTESISAPQKIDNQDLLRPDGANSASVLKMLPKADRARINEYLGEILPVELEVESRLLGSYGALEFKQSSNGHKASTFPASSMSDGTLRSFGVLLAAFQNAETGPLLIGLEEPETAVHPAAARVLMRALMCASARRQVLVTSHSPDLLDDPDLEESSLLSVLNKDGISYIGRVDAASRKMLKDHLFTAGELLRDNQLTIDRSDLDASVSGSNSELLATTGLNA